MSVDELYFINGGSLSTGAEDFLVSSDGQIANLIPGITAEAKISTEKTTVMKMLLRKLDFIN